MAQPVVYDLVIDDSQLNKEVSVEPVDSIEATDSMQPHPFQLDSIHRIELQSGSPQTMTTLFEGTVDFSNCDRSGTEERTMTTTIGMYNVTFTMCVCHTGNLGLVRLSYVSV
jgi:hypothetical protein